ncbi:Hcp family type VI secretion system effector [Bosea vaviloviae]|uniref:Hcp1 family type VI secretion system effector n=1 Tax=Bosea vaviloviae TaxID=1526658 RepID=A0A1D7U339_9HYPH|nr:type VI secretion system tube protein Hcp [Bosea vaviloviae]AOO81775.1 hypothetical protein BHK69_16130 [Bosea vaviloviae]
MAEDIFLKIESDKVDGESADKGHKGELEIQSWSWGVSNAGSAHRGTGAGTGKASFSDASFMMTMDKAAPILMQSSGTGVHHKKCTLTQRRAGGKEQVEFIKLTMEDVLVSSVQLSSSSQDAMVSFTLNFAKFKIEYTPQAASGGKDAKTEFSYNIAENATA